MKEMDRFYEREKGERLGIMDEANADFSRIESHEKERIQMVKYLDWKRDDDQIEYATEEEKAELQTFCTEWKRYYTDQLKKNRDTKMNIVLQRSRKQEAAFFEQESRRAKIVETIRGTGLKYLEEYAVMIKEKVMVPFGAEIEIIYSVFWAGKQTIEEDELAAHRFLLARMDAVVGREQEFRLDILQDELVHRSDVGRVYREQTRSLAVISQSYERLIVVLVVKEARQRQEQVDVVLFATYVEYHIEQEKEIRRQLEKREEEMWEKMQKNRLVNLERVKKVCEKTEAILQFQKDVAGLRQGIIWAEEDARRQLYISS